jgi:thioesterase domain-containing protein
MPDNNSGQLAETSIAEVINTTMEFAIPVAHNMGVRVVEASPGHAVATMPFEGNGNHFGVMYAGVLFTVAEVLGGVISIASFDNSTYYPLVKDLRITFLRPAKSSVRATATLDEETLGRIEAEAAAKGKADFVLDAVVTDDGGQVVATTQGLYQLRAIGR